MISLTTFHDIPLLGFAAYSGTGKTTLLEQLIPELNQANIRVAMVKHTHHEKFDIDKPGKDSYRLRKAGAEQMLVASAKRWALMVEHPAQATLNEPDLFELLPHLDLSKADLILVEGFKHENISKIELHRPISSHYYIPMMKILLQLPVISRTLRPEIVTGKQHSFIQP
jgi:molybdopterin-guanine dinucleotide biosynthesis protein MobB